MNRASFLPVVVVVAACAGPASLAGRSEAELRAYMGPPAAEYPNGDGSRTLAYPQGAFGTQTYIAEVAPGGEVRSVRQALGDDTFARIHPGMTRDEVLRLVGPPGDSMDFPRQREVSWEYRFIDTWGYRAYFYVNFDPRGIVVSKLIRRVESDRSDLR